MNSTRIELIDPRICVRLTETLLHFLWEGAAIGFCALLMAWLYRNSAAQIRYSIHGCSLAAMALCVPITFALTDSPDLTQVERGAIASVEKDDSNFTPSSDRSSIANQSTTKPEGGLNQPVSSASTDTTVSSSGSFTEPVAERRNAVFVAKESRFDAVLRVCAPIAITIYFCGVLVMLSRLGCALWGGQRLRRSATAIEDRQLLLQIRSQAMRIGLRFVPIVAYCERISIPVVAGIIRPVILLPSWIVTDFDPEHLLLILTHEMAHIRRFDLYVNLLQRLVETALFFHPAVWCVSRQLSLERENCCDDLVVQTGYNRVQYACVLVRLAELCALNRQPIPTVPLVTLAADGRNGTQLKHRVMRLLNGTQRLRLTRSDSWLLLLMAALFAGTAAGVLRQASAAHPDQVDANRHDVSDDRLATRQKAEATAETVDVTGQLLDGRGEPIGQALVCLAVSRSHEITWEGPMILATSESSGSGRFQLSAPKSEVSQYESGRRNSFEIWVHKPGFNVAMHQTFRVPPSNPVELRLEPETKFEVSLRDAQGSPCAGAAVTPLSVNFEHETWLSIPHLLRKRLETACDANGRTQLKGIRLEQIRNLRFSHPAYGTQTYYSRPGLPIATELTLLPVGIVKGKLQIPSGVDVDLTKFRLRVATLNPKLDDPDEYWAGDSEIQPDKAGHFSIPHMATGSIRIFSYEPDDFPLRADPPREAIVVSAGATSILNIPLNRAIRVSQLFRDADSKRPLRNIEVHFQHQNLKTRTRTDNAGLINVLLLPGTRYHRYVEIPEGYIAFKGRASAPYHAKIPAGVDQHMLETDEYRLGRTVEGVVLDATGKPMADAQVKATWIQPIEAHRPDVEEVKVSASSQPEGTKLAYGHTDKLGRFTITGIDPQVEFTLTPLRAGVALNDSVHIGANEKQALIIKTKPFDFTAINGRVVDTEGLPVEGAKVYIYARREGQIALGCRTYTGSDGSYRSPPHLVKGQEYRITIMSNKLDVESAWHTLKVPNLTLPDIVVNRKAMEMRSFIERPPAGK